MSLKPSAKDMVTRARVQLILRHPFLGVLALGLRVREDTTGYVPTIGVTEKDLIYNSDFIESVGKDQMVGLMAHEIMHVVYQHVLEWRSSSKRESPELFTMAQEYVVNDAVVNMFQLSLPPNPILSKEYKGMYTEEVYQLLLKKYPPEDRGGVAALLKKGMSDVHKAPEGSGKTTSEQMKGLSQDLKARMCQAANAAKSRGTLPSGLQRLIDETLDPKLPWQQLLANFVSEMTRDDYSMRRPNKRHLYRGLILPSLRSETIEVAVGIDTSGSISREDLAEFWAEVRGIMGIFPSYKIHLLACDAEVHSFQTLCPWDEVDMEGVLKGGGGTSAIPVLRKIEDEDLSISALIFFTDGYTDFGEEPGYPVLWCIKGGFTDVPYGIEVHMD